MSTTREEQCLSWEVHAAARTTELCAKLDKAPERGVPAVAMKPSQVLVKGYREAAAAMKTAMLKYVERLAGLKETTAMLQAVCTEGERPVVTLTAASCMRQDERIGSTHAVMPEQGIFKLMLSRRCPVAAGLKATQTYVLRAHTGSWICVPLRNCIPEPLSVQHLTLAVVRHQRGFLNPTPHSPAPFHASLLTFLADVKLACPSRCTSMPPLDGILAVRQTSRRPSKGTCTHCAHRQALQPYGLWTSSPSPTCTHGVVSSATSVWWTTRIHRVRLLWDGVRAVPVNTSLFPPPSSSHSSLPTTTHPTLHPARQGPVPPGQVDLP